MIVMVFYEMLHGDESLLLGGYETFQLISRARSNFFAVISHGILYRKIGKNCCGVLYGWKRIGGDVLG